MTPPRPDFDAGDLVVCVDDAPNPRRPAVPVDKLIRRGRTYRVEAVFLSKTKTRWGITLIGVQLPPPTVGFNAARFRKIDKADEGFTAWVRALNQKERTNV